MFAISNLKNMSPDSALAVMSSKFYDTSINQSKIVNLLTGEQNDDTDCLNRAIVGASGLIYMITKSSGGYQYHVRSGDSEEWVSDPCENAGDILEQDGQYSGYSVISDIQAGCQTNEIVAKLCSLFSTSKSVDFTTVTSVVNEFRQASTADGDLSRMYDLLLSAQTDGKVSTWNFLTIINGMINTGKDAADDGTTLMDTSSPFAIQSFMSTVLAVASTVLQVILPVMSSTLGALGYVAGSLFSAAVEYAKIGVSNTLTADLDSTNFYVHGPVKYSYDWINGNGAPLSDDYINDTGIRQALEAVGDMDNVPFNNNIQYSQWGPFEMYTWRNGRYLSNNTFISVGFNVERAFNVLLGKTAVPQTEVDYGSLLDDAVTISRELVQDSPLMYRAKIQFSGAQVEQADPFEPTSVTTLPAIKDMIYSDEYYRMSPSECLAIAGDSKKLTRYVWACLWLDQFLSQYVYYQSTAYSAAWMQSTNYDNASYRMAEFTQYHIHDTVFATWWALKSNFSGDFTLDDITLDGPGTSGLSFWPSNARLTENIQDWYRSSVPLFADKSGLDSWEVYYEISSNEGSSGAPIGYLYNDPTLPMFFSMWNCGVGVGGPRTWTPICYYPWFSRAIFNRDNIATDRMIHIPDITVSAAIAVLLATAVATAAVLVGYSKVSKLVRCKLARKRHDQQQNLTALTDEYNRNPTDANWNALWKATRKYNRKAKLFGWQTYDINNKWFDNPSSTASTTSRPGADTAALNSLTKADDTLLACQNILGECLNILHNISAN